MARFKLDTNRFNYPKMESHTAETGSRVYYTPAGEAPSVTTILSTLPHPELDAWRERVGEEEADRISKEATTIGTYMHDRLEFFVRGEKYIEPEGYNEELMSISKKMFQVVKLFGLFGLDKVWGIEEALHYEDLYAGRTDLVGIYKGKPSIIDYKTSKFFKATEYLENYKLQLAAYTIAHEWMFPEVEFTQGVLLIGTRPNPEYRKTAEVQVIIIPEEELDVYKIKWTEVLDGFYKNA